MKYIITFLFLLFISTAYCDIFSDIEERECKKQQEDYSECIDAFNSMVSNGQGNFEIFCSKKCKKFFNDPKKATPDCYDNSESLQKILDSIKELSDMNCATDGGGNFCPNTQALIDQNYVSTLEEGMDIAKKTCKSKYCTDALIKIHQSINLEYSKDVITFLNSKECRDQNSSVSLNIGMSLVLSIVMFFTFVIVF